MGKRGFIIIELAIAMTVALLAFAVLFLITFTIQDNIGVTSGILNINEKGRIALNRISIDIREAKSVLTSYGSYTTGATTIILQVPSIDGSSDILLDGDGDIAAYDTIIYTLDSVNPKKLIRRVYADTSSSRDNGTETITECINTLSFTGLFTETVTIEIITSATLAGFVSQSKIITSASLRNK